MGVCLDAEQNIYVYDWGHAMCVKVYRPDGTPLRVIGKSGGRPEVGKYDPEGMLLPRQIVVDKNNPATSFLPDTWERKDEWYNFKELNPDVHVLIRIDETSYTGGENGANHPMAWYHDFDGGRAFYTEMGHTDESYSDPLYLKHILAGIQYAIGN